MKILLVALIVLPLALFGAKNKEDEKYEIGKTIYETTCISCHGIDGNTNQDIKLVVKPRKLTKTILTQAQSIKVISEGARFWGAKADTMPAWKYVYSQEQIESVAFYIHKAFNQNGDDRVKKYLAQSTQLNNADKKKMLRIGEKIFKRNCALCHGVSGDGESEYVEKSKASSLFIYPYNLTKTLLTQEQIFLYIKFGGHYWGTDKKDMPSWKKKYDDVKLKSVAKYVKEKIIVNP